MNAAESGLERAMWSINKKHGGASESVAWDAEGWSAHPVLGGNTACQTFNLGTVAGGATVTAKVYVNDRTLAATSPFAIARAIVTPTSGPAIEKWIKITLYQRSFFANGLVAKNGITFSGNNPSVDSYDSRLGDYNATLANGKTNRNANGSAASASTKVESLSVGNANIYGPVSIGTSDNSGLYVGPKGVVSSNLNAPDGTIDYSLVTNNFSASFDSVTNTSPLGTTLGTLSADKTLPENPATDSNYQDVTDTSGTTTRYYYYNATSINLQNTQLKIRSGYNVIITVNGAVSTGGNSGSILIDSTPSSRASLELYVSGNVDIGGQGAANQVTTTTTTTTTEKVQGQWVTTSSTTTTTTMGRPQDFKIWGTGDSSQSIKISGNGNLSGVVYAPNAAVEAKGGGNSGSIYGAFVANTVKMTGNDAFHYDEALASLNLGAPLGIDEWNEFVSSADRTKYETVMTF